VASHKKVAFITGANEEIGFETARGLGELGITIVIGRRDESKGRAAGSSPATAVVSSFDRYAFSCLRNLAACNTLGSVSRLRLVGS
jgi:NAD(P)-dependent dehydrogenase (short-subunit alcohol dehydrogenase family)